MENICSKAKKKCQKINDEIMKMPATSQKWQTNMLLRIAFGLEIQKMGTTIHRERERKC